MVFLNDIDTKQNSHLNSKQHYITVYNRTVLKTGSCCTVRPGKVSCLQKFRHFWMIIRDLFFESGSTEAIKIKKYCKGTSFIFLIK